MTNNTSSGEPVRKLSDTALVHKNSVVSSSGAKGVSSNPAGMGAFGLPGKKGTAFRVWAPHASAVSVIGAFNNWDASRHPFVREEHDTWFAWVAEASPGDEYLFHICTEDNKAGFKRPDPRARKVVNSVGNCIIWHPPVHDPGARFVPPSLDQAVVYELHIGSFNVPPFDRDAKGETARRPGSFASAIEKLPYLRDLGVNVVELMPVAEFAGDFSWGYNPAHPFAVESAYGGPEGLLAFVEAAHAQGIAVLLDVVYNHLGPSDLSLWQFDGWSENNLGGIYFYNDWRADTPWGANRPDYGRGEVRSYLRDNARQWLADFGVDGLRWDMALFIRTVHGEPEKEGDVIKEGWSLCQWINDDLHREFPRAIFVAEDLRDHEPLVKASVNGGAGFNTQWDAAFVHPLREAMIVTDDASRDLDKIIAALKNRYDGDAFKRVVYSESHDEVANGKARLPSEVAPSEPAGFHARKRSLLGAGLVFTAPGIPMLFQGQEFLEDDWFRDNVPVDWEKCDAYAGIHACYRDLIALRRNFAGHTAGLCGQYIETHHVNHLAKILGFHRRREPSGGAGDDVVVIANFSTVPVLDYKVGVPAPGRWRVRFNSDARAYSPDFSDHPAPDVESVAAGLDGFEQHIVTGIGPYSFLILSQDPQPNPQGGSSP